MNLIRKGIIMLKNLLLTVGFLGILFTGQMAGAAGGVELYVAGTHYLPIVPEQPTQTGDKIEVLEIFWYGCRHCNEFEPYITAWLSKKPENVEFRRMPATFKDLWTLHARAFYTAEALGVLEKIHSPFFKALHEENRSLVDQASLADFFAEHGVNKDDFNKTFSSFSVDSKVRQANHMIIQYKITGVPAVIVNGKYLVTGSMSGGYDELFKIVDFLVEKERKGKKQ
jgi:thiol:disulfide interchange protein DsbA